MRPCMMLKAEKSSFSPVCHLSGLSLFFRFVCHPPPLFSCVPKIRQQRINVTLLRKAPQSCVFKLLLYSFSFHLLASSPSDGPDLLEGYGAKRHGAHGVSGGLAVPVPAQHPFKSYLDLDISFSGEQADLYMQKVIVSTLSAVDALKKLFFVGNLFDSLKFLFLLYLVTYLGDLCNGLTLLIISVIAVFSLPLFYKRRQEEVDSFVAKIQAQLDSIKDTLQRLAQGGGPPPDPTPGGAKPKPQ
uniref:Reticulon n=1 Tax=Oryzias latipes TaxID=8090 RepID=A0A3P9IWR8_ORYLA